MTARSCELCPIINGMMATVRARVKTGTLNGMECSRRVYLCESCRRACESRGDIVPGAEIEVL